MAPFVRPVPIRFRDIDALDHVNHAVILTYCETVRCDWFAEAAGVASMARLPFILASAHVDYKAPMPKTAQVELAMSVPRIGTKSWDFDYAVRDARSGLQYASARTVQVAYDYAAARSHEIPPDLRRRLEALAP